MIKGNRLMQSICFFFRQFFNESNFAGGMLALYSKNVEADTESLKIAEELGRTCHEMYKKTGTVFLVFFRIQAQLQFFIVVSEDKKLLRRKQWIAEKRQKI